MKKKNKNSGTFVQKRQFCRICGSTNIEFNGREFICMNCRAVFSAPKRVKINLRKRPRYIG